MKSTLANGGRAKKTFHYCLNPYSSKQFIYFQQSRDNSIDPTLQDNVLLPKRVTEYIIHVGNTVELNSITRIGLIPGRKSLKKRHAVFFTTVKPIVDEVVWETLHATDETRNAPNKDTWKHLNKLHVGAIFKLARKACFPKETRSNAVILYNTLLAACFKEAICMKT